MLPYAFLSNTNTPHHSSTLILVLKSDGVFNTECHAKHASDEHIMFVTPVWVQLHIIQSTCTYINQTQVFS